MATRPVFVPLHDRLGVLVKQIEFAWHPGLSASQKKKSVQSLHDSARNSLSIDDILEISTKSESESGVALSAFNLKFTTRKNKLTLSVESAFQGSKVFALGGPFIDLYEADSKSAKIDQRTKTSGNLIGFSFFGTEWPTQPITAFYDWLYINALTKNPDLAKELARHEAFTDIEFNPEKSLNCQAYSAALYVSLIENGFLEEAISSQENFIDVTRRISGYGITTPRALDIKLL